MHYRNDPDISIILMVLHGGLPKHACFLSSIPVIVCIPARLDTLHYISSFIAYMFMFFFSTLHQPTALVLSIYATRKNS